MSQQEAPINKLPEELMVGVLELLDGKSLKNCALVCKKWNETIGRNSAVMKKLPLKLVKKGEGIPDPEELIRQYHTIKCAIQYPFSTLSLQQSRIMEKLISHQGRNLRVLELNNVTFGLSEAEAISKAFDSLEVLEELKLVDTNLFDEKEDRSRERYHNYLFLWRNSVAQDVAFENLKAHNIPKLKSVILQESGLYFLRLIETSQIVSLKIELSEWGLEAELKSYLIDFLITQNRLEELVFRYFGPHDYEDPVDIEKLKKINFPLKRLHIFNLSRLMRTEANTLIFLNQFSDTLEELEVSSRIRNSVIEMIFKNFLKLKTLDINLDIFPTEEAFYRNLQSNPSVQKLIIRSFPIQSSRSFMGLVGMLPNVKELIAERYLPRAEIDFIASNLKLKSLQLVIIDNEMFYGVSMPSIQFLGIRYLDVDRMSACYWKTMIDVMPNVETFAADYISDYEPSNNCFNIFTKKWLRLKHIKLGPGFVAEKLVFDQMLRNCHNLKTLEIQESAFDQFPSEREEILRDFRSNDLSFIIHSKDEGYKWSNLGRNEETQYGLWEGNARQDLERDGFEEDSDDSMDVE